MSTLETNNISKYNGNNVSIGDSLKLKNVTPMKKSIQIIKEVSVEVENRKRYACVAETVLRVYY